MLTLVTPAFHEQHRLHTINGREPCSKLISMATSSDTPICPFRCPSTGRKRVHVFYSTAKAALILLFYFIDSLSQGGLKGTSLSSKIDVNTRKASVGVCVCLCANVFPAFASP